MLVGVDTKVRYKGVEYSRLDDIPPDIRRPLDKTLRRLNGSGEGIATLNSRIILNGQTVTDPMLLCEDDQRLIAKSIGALLPVDTAVCLAAVMERKHRIRGTIGLGAIFASLGVYVMRLWSHGYFAGTIGAF